MDKNLYIGDIDTEHNNSHIIEKVIDNFDEILFVYQIRMALEENDLLDIDRNSLNTIINIAVGCLDSIEFLDEEGSRRSYDFWLEKNHETENEYFVLFDAIIKKYSDDSRILDLMAKRSGFVVLDSLLEDSIDNCWNVLEENNETEHRSFIIDDQLNR